MKADDVSKSLKDLDSWTKDASGLGAEEISNITTTLEDLFFFSFTDLEVSEHVVNPFVTNELTNHNHLDEPTFIYRGIEGDTCM